MPDILQDFPIHATVERVYAAVSTAEGLNHWWTDTCTGRSAVGGDFTLDFGPAFHWRAVVSVATPFERFELTITQADEDWTGTRVEFELHPDAGGTLVRFAHRGWQTAHEHYRVSSHCWALYLRLLRRYLEYGETVPYPDRLGA